jgi:RNA polymerase sigma-70 factor, ECF subfamily
VLRGSRLVLAGVNRHSPLATADDVDAFPSATGTARQSSSLLAGLKTPDGISSSGTAVCSEYSAVMVDVEQASDANLVVAVGRWHEQALAEVYRRHGGAVHALARRILRSDPPAEEITQEVFLDLWNHPEKFDAQRGTLRSFLLARTHGKSVDYVRSEMSRRRREEKTSRETATAGYDIDREVWDMAVAEQVQEALVALPDELRRPIELAYFGGHTYREVAQMLDEPEGTVKSRIRSGLGRLRINLAERGVQPAGAEQ